MNRTLVSLVLAVALVVTGCSTSEPESKPPTPTERAAFAPGPYEDGDLDADVEALAGWGIATYEDASAATPMVAVTPPEAPVSLLRSQVETMGREAAAGIGTRGADLDAVFTESFGQELHVSTMLAAWLQSGSEMAQDLRAALPQVDAAAPEQSVFPTIVLTGFVRDLGLSPGDPEATATYTASPAAFVAPRAIDPCSVDSQWVENMIGKLFDGLKISFIDTSQWADGLVPLGWLLNFFIAAYDAIRQGAKWVVIQGYKVLIAPIRNALAQISLVIALVQTALTSIHPLTSTWTGPGEPEFGVIGDPELRYELTLNVTSTNPLVWPEVLQRCARAAGVDLPNPSLEGSKVAWYYQTAEGGVLRKLDADEALLADSQGGGRATFRFLTGQEPLDWKERGDTNFTQAAVAAVVERKNTQIKEAADAAVKASLNELLIWLPPFLRENAVGAIRQQLDGLLNQLVVTSKYEATKVFYVKKHMKPDETPTPSPSPPTPSASPPAPKPVWVYVDRPGIPGSVEPGRILEFVACDGLAGTWRGKLRTGGLYDDDGFEVPWADLPARPFRIGKGGIGSTTTVASGVTQVLGKDVPLTFNLRISVDGRTMTVDGVPVQPPVSFRGIPIRNTPKGMCS